MSTHTVRPHRVLRASAERVHRAFVEPAAMAKWMPPCGLCGTVHHGDARVGGGFCRSFSSFAACRGQAFGADDRELVPSQRLRCTDEFDAPGLPGQTQVTVAFVQVSCGTELTLLREGIAQVIPRRRAAWDGSSRWCNWPRGSSRRFPAEPRAPHLRR
jgi:uncharacterized protein YndB with AHSA1/START domain